MSKSKGEFLTVSLLESKGYNPLVYRYFCLGSHYRSQLVFSYDGLDQATIAYNKLKNKVNSLDKTPSLQEDKVSIYQEKFKEYLNNDLNTASCLTLLYDVLKDNELTDFTKLYLIEDFDKVLSLGLTDEEEVEVDEARNEEILKKIEERKEAKKNKDFAKADQIRDDLLKEGIKLIDSREGTTYEII
jgi:cysteinyl-tRNA synthetase